MKFHIEVSGDDYTKTRRWLNRLRRINVQSVLVKYGRIGVERLKAATPAATGITSSSWDFVVERTAKGQSLVFTNSNAPYGVPIVILIQYGHATRNGGYVMGRDFINPAIKPVAEELARELWKEVSVYV